MNFKEKFMSVLELLHLKQKFDDKKPFTLEEFNSIVAEYGKKYQTSLKDDLKAEEKSKKSDEQQAEMQAMLNSIQQVVATINPAAESTEQPRQDATLASILESLNGIRADFPDLHDGGTCGAHATIDWLVYRSSSGHGRFSSYASSGLHSCFGAAALDDARHFGWPCAADVD